MTLDEAIELLKPKLNGLYSEGELGTYQAIQLGIEALEAIAFWNQKQLPQHQIKLPSETEGGGTERTLNELPRL